MVSPKQCWELINKCTVLFEPFNILKSVFSSIHSKYLKQLLYIHHILIIKLWIQIFISKPLLIIFVPTYWNSIFTKIQYNFIIIVKCIKISCLLWNDYMNNFYLFFKGNKYFKQVIFTIALLSDRY